MIDKGNQLSVGAGTTESEETNNKLSSADFSLCLNQESQTKVCATSDKNA
jgi:hypothetical protein